MWAMIEKFRMSCIMQAASQVAPGFVSPWSSGLSVKDPKQ
jgi:hypothetical protein